MKYNHILFAIVALTAVLTVGCNKNPYGTIDITGKVTVDGQPMEGVSVTMAPVNSTKDSGQRAAGGVTLEDGTVRFVSAGSPVAGVMPGEYVLTFQKEIWLTDDGAPADQIPYDPSKPSPPTHPVDLIPAKYKDPKNSEFHVTVVDKNSTFEVDISTKE